MSRAILRPSETLKAVAGVSVRPSSRASGWGVSGSDGCPVRLFVFSDGLKVVPWPPCALSDGLGIAVLPPVFSDGLGVVPLPPYALSDGLGITVLPPVFSDGLKVVPWPPCALSDGLGIAVLPPVFSDGLGEAGSFTF